MKPDNHIPQFQATDQNTHRAAAKETNSFSKTQLLMRFENIHRLGTKKLINSLNKKD